ncbi:MAG: glycoside hydrolase family 16 protein [Bacteroidales bacterium]|nr:glycoside hydrolase family 16 protein [Bacteroidales bacterium]
MIVAVSKNRKKEVSGLILFSFIILFLLLSNISYSQCNQLVWSDEFDGTEVDASKWTFQTGNGCPNLCGWGKLENYTSGTNNTTVANGILTMTVKKEASGGSEFSSAKLVTLGKYSRTYGRFEARMRMPKGVGMWPAFWMLSAVKQLAYDGEIDIMEYRGDQPRINHGTLHYGQPWPDNRYDGTNYTHTADLDQDFHIYAVEWTADDIKWYFDNTLFKTETRDPNSLNPLNNNTSNLWPWTSDFYIILNLAVGGGFCGNPTAAQITLTKPTFEIDYVRVYSSGSGGVINPTAISGSSKVFANTSNQFSISEITGASYTWSAQNATIKSGQGTNAVQISFPSESTYTLTLDVTVPASGQCPENTFKLTKTISVLKDACTFVYADFDNRTLVDVGAASGTALVVNNPATNTVNNSAKVMSYARNASEQYDNVALNNALIPNGSQFENGDMAFEMDVYSSQAVGTIVELQIASSSAWNDTWPTGRHTTYRATTTKVNTWETLHFMLNETADPNRATFQNNLDRIIILFKPNSTTAGTYYFDNLKKVTTVAAVAPTVVSPIEIEQNTTTSALTAIGTNLLWYTTQTGGAGTMLAPIPSTADAGSSKYYVSQTISGCESTEPKLL